MITYVVGDAAALGGIKILAHVVNLKGYWGKGFVMAVEERWPGTKAAYRDFLANSEHAKLGRIMFCPYNGIVIANMIAQEDIARRSNPNPLDYQALESCLGELANTANYLQASIHMPRIGTGLAGGDWKKIEPLITKYLNKHDVTIYSL